MLGVFVFNILVYFSCWVTSHRLAQDFPILLVKLKHIFSAEDKKRTEVEENWFQKLWAPTLHKKNQWVDLKTTKKKSASELNWLGKPSVVPEERIREQKSSTGRGDTAVGLPSWMQTELSCSIFACKTSCSGKGLTCLLLCPENSRGKSEVFQQQCIKDTETVTTGLWFFSLLFFLLLQFYHSKCRRMSDDSSLGVFTSVWTYSFSFSFPFPPTIWGLLKSFFYLWKGTGQHDKEKFLIWTLNHFQNWKVWKEKKGEFPSAFSYSVTPIFQKSLENIKSENNCIKRECFSWIKAHNMHLQVFPSIYHIFSGRKQEAKGRENLVLIGTATYRCRNSIKLTCSMIWHQYTIYPKLYSFFSIISWKYI